MWVALTREQAEIAWLMGQPIAPVHDGNVESFAAAVQGRERRVVTITRAAFDGRDCRADCPTLQDWIDRWPACPNVVFAIWVED